MLTKWAKKLLSTTVYTRVGSGSGTPAIPSITSSTSQKAYIKAKSYNGNDIYINTAIYDGWRANMITGSIGSTSYGVMFGEGNTPSSEQDYFLEDRITNITANTPSAQYAYDDTNQVYKVFYDYVITNNGTDEIEISEIGSMIRVNQTSTKGGTQLSVAPILVDRTVLNTPVVIPGGEAGTVRYEFDYEIGNE